MNHPGQPGQLSALSAPVTSSISADDFVLHNLYPWWILIGWGYAMHHRHMQTGGGCESPSDARKYRLCVETPTCAHSAHLTVAIIDTIHTHTYTEAAAPPLPSPELGSLLSHAEQNHQSWVIRLPPQSISDKKKIIINHQGTRGKLRSNTSQLPTVNQKNSAKSMTNLGRDRTNNKN